ncbi:MAG TPA: tetratricopeptide repeat protein, partial [Acidimicrobiales bacterium]
SLSSGAVAADDNRSTIDRGRPRTGLYAATVNRLEERWGWSGPRWLGSIGVQLRRTMDHLMRNEPPEDVLELQEKLLARSIRWFGIDSWQATNGRADVARRLERLGRFDEARLLRERVLADRRQHLGDDHFGSLRAEEMLALNLYNAGSQDEGRSMYRRVIEAYRHRYGPEYPTTVRAEEILARMDPMAGRG